MRNWTEHGFSRLTAISDAGSTPAASTNFNNPGPSASLGISAAGLRRPLNASSSTPAASTNSSQCPHPSKQRRIQRRNEMNSRYDLPDETPVIR